MNFRRSGENMLDRFNRRNQRQLVPEAAGLTGVIQDSDAESDSESENKGNGSDCRQVVTAITSKDIRSWIKNVVRSQHRGSVKYIKDWIKAKAFDGQAVWPPEIMKYLHDSHGITSISEPEYYFELVEKIFLMIMSLIKKIPLSRYCQPGRRSEWFPRLSNEDQEFIAHRHGVLNAHGFLRPNLSQIREREVADRKVHEEPERRSCEASETRRRRGFRDRRTSATTAESNTRGATLRKTKRERDRNVLCNVPKRGKKYAYVKTRFTW